MPDLGPKSFPDTAARDYQVVKDDVRGTLVRLLSISSHGVCQVDTFSATAPRTRLLYVCQGP